MKSTNKNQYLRPYLFHGVEITEDPTEAQGDCPFCDKANHFYVKTATGQFRCVVCEESGNIPVFLSRLLEYSQAKTEEADYQPLSEDRGIPSAILRQWGVAKSIITGEWLIPAYNAKGKLANLSRIVKVQDEDGKERWKVYNTPTCKLHPFGTNLLNKNHQTVFITEGPWDGMKLHSVLLQARDKTSRPLDQNAKLIKTTNPALSLYATSGVIAVPGAGNFNPDWLDHTTGRTAILTFDNDHPRQTPSGKTFRPGWDGQQRIAKICRDEERGPDTLYQIRWGKPGHDASRPDGFDLRDLFNEAGPISGLKSLYSLLEAVPLDTPASPKEAANGEASAIPGASSEPEPIDPLPRSSFAQLCDDFNASLHFTDQLRDTLAAMLAVQISTDLGGDQLWLRIIGPPGSGKSTLAECGSASRRYSLPLSIVTGFHSGFVGKGKRSKQKDASLIPTMQGKTVFIKDADTLISAPNRDKILSEMRDLYDGTSRAEYRNRVSNRYENIRTTFVLCGTDALRGLDRSFLGDRFLDCEIFAGNETKPYLDRAAENTYRAILDSISPKEETGEAREDKLTYLKRCTIGYLHHLKDNLTNLPQPKLPTDNAERIKALGQLLAHLRARKDRDENATYRPRVELATRLVSQFVKLAVCLAYVLGKTTIDPEVIRIVRKIATDTGTGYHLEIVTLLAQTPTGVEIKTLTTTLNIPETTIRRLLKEMAEFGITTRNTRPNKSGQRGRDLHVWLLTPELLSTYRQALT